MVQKQILYSIAVGSEDYNRSCGNAWDDPYTIGCSFTREQTTFWHTWVRCNPPKSTRRGNHPYGLFPL